MSLFDWWLPWRRATKEKREALKVEEYPLSFVSPTGEAYFAPINLEVSAKAKIATEWMINPGKLELPKDYK